ncbi:hypothetical protein Tco_0971685 [Tanacetum coccineum]
MVPAATPDCYCRCRISAPSHLTTTVSHWHQNQWPLSFENSAIGSPTSLRDNNAHATMATVHLLPLLPQAQISNKPHSVPKTPRQSRWQKGKLIGRTIEFNVCVGAGMSSTDANNRQQQPALQSIGGSESAMSSVNHHSQRKS